MSERERRLGLNEAVFREVNERIRDIKQTFEPSMPSQWQTQDLDLVCECGDPSCVDRISMSIDEYERVRADSRQFAIVPGHNDRAIESVISHERTYDVVRKRGEAATLAEATDQRDN